MHPIIIPTDIITNIASIINPYEFPDFIIDAPNILLKPIIPIIEKSIPPFINTNVKPQESMKRKDACVKTEVKLAILENPGINIMEIKKYMTKKGITAFLSIYLPIFFTGLVTNIIHSIY